MSLYYENGQLARIRFIDYPEGEPKSNACDVGTHFSFVKQLDDSPQEIEVRYL